MTTAPADRAAIAAARDEFRRAEFNETFAAALTPFSENVAAWQLGWRLDARWGSGRQRVT